MTRSKPIAQAEHGANRRENKVAGSKKLATLATFATKDTGKYPSVEKEEDIVVNQNVTPTLPNVDKDLFNAAPALLRDMIRPGLEGRQRDMATVSTLTMSHMSFKTSQAKAIGVSLGIPERTIDR
ncbi:hypothetical protein, partial [uncultured Parabacteroides sp.]|uniref:hypothetical protein n=1 Tax=uncultured Parabacteroides sp. TaxID=512312 RepID=UPI00259B59FA